MKIQVNSEIGRLRKVLVHRPGKEVERLYPEIFKRLLFDDIMFLEQAQLEHDTFTSKLREEGVEVFYIEKLIAELLDETPSVRETFIKEFIAEANINNATIKDAAFVFLDSIKDNYELVKSTIAGITKREITPNFTNSIIDIVAKDDEYPIYIDPIPNILFQRDPIASIFDKVNIHKMWTVTRRRESIYYRFLFKYHKDFKNIENLMLPSDPGSMEGGDILVISKKVIFIGLSQRTNPDAIQSLANKLFKGYSDLKNIIAIEIPKAHATMHLDTVLTQMDINKFSIDSDMVSIKYSYFNLRKDRTTVKKQALIKDILEEYVHPNIKLFVVGNGSPIRARREQWNDGANCLAIKPGTICVYDRNKITNALLKKEGIRLIEIPSSELSRGRGGPRCMSMPLFRDEVK